MVMISRILFMWAKCERYSTYALLMALLEIGSVPFTTDGLVVSVLLRLRSPFEDAAVPSSPSDDTGVPLEFGMLEGVPVDLATSYASP